MITFDHTNLKFGTTVLIMKITLKQRKLKDGKINLSIEFYRGSEISSDGKRRHLRDLKILKFISSKSQVTSNWKRPREKIRKIINYNSINSKNTGKELRRSFPNFATSS